MVRRIYYLVAFCLIFCGFINAQTISQMGFVIKKGLPEIEHIAVICNLTDKDKITNEAKTAYLVTRKQFHVYAIKSHTDLPKVMQGVRDFKNCAVIIVTDNQALNQKSVKYIAQKLGLKKIPVISNRDGDTKLGAIFSIIKEGEAIQTHLSKVAINALQLSLSDEFVNSCVLDVP